jgi:plasmid stability protein
MLGMATLTIRNLPDEVRDKLRIRAAHAGRSMEAEARAILIEGLLKRKLSDAQLGAGLRRAQTWVAAHRKSVAGEASSVDALIRDRRREVIAEVIEEGLDPESYFGAEFGRICSEAEWTADHVRKLRRGSA